MTRERIGQLVFFGALALTLIVYGLSVPEGLPWVPMAGADWWGYVVDAAYDHPCAAGVVLAAVAAGLLGALVNRYFGWRVATSAALVWIFMPPVWYGASVGSRPVAMASLIVISLWLVNAVILRVSRKARRVQGMSGGTLESSDPSRNVWSRRVAWGWLVAAGVFALVSLAMHDYRYGEAASAFAKGVVREAAGRIIVVELACEPQVVEEVEKIGEGEGVGVGAIERSEIAERSVGLREGQLRYVSFFEVARDRNAFVDAVRATFPGETNLWAAARVSAKMFLDVAIRRHPDRFYLMTGASSTKEGWERRWTDFEPYLKSRDPFLPVARRLFGYEGNAVANRLEPGEAWPLYDRLYREVDPENFSALVNMNELLRGGYAASDGERRRVHEALDQFFRDTRKRNHMREIAERSGPIRVDEKRLAQLREESKRRLAEKVANGELTEIPDDMQTLLEWNDDMIAAMEAHDTVRAGRIARAILSKEEWRGFIPANAILATVAAQEGDYVAAEQFFAIATATTNQMPFAVLNDYADTLLHLGKLDEAEKWARRAIAESDPRIPMAKMTLAEVLIEKRERGQGTDEERKEIVSLLGDAMKYAPPDMKPRIRQMQGKAARR